MANLFSNVYTVTERKFRFDDYQTLKNVWQDYVRKKSSNKVAILISQHKINHGFWIVPFDYKNELLQDSLLFNEVDVEILFRAIDNEIKINSKTKRCFLIKADEIDGCILTVNGLIVNTHKSLNFLFGKTLQQIKPFLKELPNVLIKELSIKVL